MKAILKSFKFKPEIIDLIASNAKVLGFKSQSQYLSYLVKNDTKNGVATHQGTSDFDAKYVEKMLTDFKFEVNKNLINLLEFNQKKYSIIARVFTVMTRVYEQFFIQVFRLYDLVYGKRLPLERTHSDLIQILANPAKFVYDLEMKTVKEFKEKEG